MGYQIKNTNVYFDKMNEETILLNKQYKNCDEVAVVSYGTTRCGFHGCCLWSITKKSFSSTQKDIAQKEFFKLFPNPASRGTQINIQLPKETPAGSKLQLYNISGQLILQQQINRKPDIQKMQLPEIAPGTYHVLVLNSQSQKIFAGKLVVL